MANLYSLLIATLINYNVLFGGAAQSVCSRGEKSLRLTGTQSDVCVPCEKWAFMDEDNHSHTACKRCMFIEDPDVEVFAKRCNTTHDTVILCQFGFYRRRARTDRQKDRCEECTYCPHPTRACQGYQDTLCCHPNQDAVMTSSGEFVCEKRPVVCGPGQFFSTSTEECLPCPAETFMSAHSHTYKECLKCEQLTENKATHGIITRPCSRTAPTLFGCEDGYFRDPTQESSQKEVPCTPCRSCDRSLVDCGMFHDAVCEVKEETIAAISSASDTADDAENSAKGKSQFNFGSDERNQSLNTTTEPKNHAPFDLVTLVTCVTLIAILMSTLYHFISNLKSGQLYRRSHRQTSRQILGKHHVLIFCTIWGILSVSLIFCIVCTAEPVIMSNVVYDVYVTMTVIATGVFIIVVITCSCRRTNRSHEDRNDDERSQSRVYRL